jgi:hypothetical protein
LQQLPKEYMELPAMAMRCVLDGLMFPAEQKDWSMETMHRMSECLSTVAAAVACLKVCQTIFIFISVFFSLLFSSL